MKFEPFLSYGGAVSSTGICLEKIQTCSGKPKQCFCFVFCFVFVGLGGPGGGFGAPGGDFF